MKTVASSILALAASLLLACGTGATGDTQPSNTPEGQQESALCPSSCGDRFCDVNSEAYSCPQDCGNNVCGDRRCCNENPTVCPQDCPFASNLCYYTPDTLGAASVDREVAPLPEPRPRYDAATLCPGSCGDNRCDINTEAYSCPQDCGNNVCGDRRCCHENSTVCPQDCPYDSNLCYYTPDN